MEAYKCDGCGDFMDDRPSTKIRNYEGVEVDVYVCVVATNPLEQVHQKEVHYCASCLFHLANRIRTGSNENEPDKSH